MIWDRDFVLGECVMLHGVRSRAVQQASLIRKRAWAHTRGSEKKKDANGVQQRTIGP